MAPLRQTRWGHHPAQTPLGISAQAEAQAEAQPSQWCSQAPMLCCRAVFPSSCSRIIRKHLSLTPRELTSLGKRDSVGKNGFSREST